MIEPWKSVSSSIHRDVLNLAEAPVWDAVTEKVELKRPGGKAGIVILRKHYDVLSIFILKVLEVNQEITLIELLEAAKKNISTKPSGEILWVIINVKHDLEARGLIKIRYMTRCVQVISLNRNKKGILDELLRSNQND
jgi:hypothetical protein